MNPFPSIQKYTPICIPNHQIGMDSYGKDATVIGFGFTDYVTKNSPELLQETTVKVLRKCPDNWASTRQLCAYSPGKDACQVHFKSTYNLLLPDIYIG